MTRNDMEDKMATQLKAVVTISFLNLFLLTSPGWIQAQWFEQSHWPRIGGEALDACNPQTAVFSRNLSLFKTVDGGNTWKELSKASDDAFTAWDISMVEESHIWI
ncbi:MAG: hypothetical protein ACRENG_29665, partial [bacterium]